MGINFQQEFPRSGSAKDITRISIVAYQIQQQNLNPRDPNHIQKGGLLSRWSFIGFEDLQEAITHNWEPYDTMLGRASEKISTAKSDATEVVSMAGSISGIKGGQPGILSAGNTEAAKYKVDTPLVYTGSQRRQITFSFVLQEYRDAYVDVLEPIHEFRRLSCAGIEGQSVDKIDFPAIFSINSIPRPFIHINDAALTDVQVTWNSPHMAGVPKKAELTLTFTDIRPLYKSSWGDSDGKITATVDATSNIKIGPNGVRGL